MGISKLTGTPWHMETLHSEDSDRRHKTRCINYNQGSCTYYLEVCRGSAHCTEYNKDHSFIQTCQQPIISENPNKTISINSKVELYDFAERKKFTVTICKSDFESVSENEYIISSDSDLGKELIGKNKGTVVTVNQYRYSINKFK